MIVGIVKTYQSEVVGQTDGEGSPNTRTSQLGLEVEVNKVIKRLRTNDAPISPVGESNPAVRVQVLNSCSPELIFKALKNIPDLARTDILRAYSALICDDRRFESRYECTCMFRCCLMQFMLLMLPSPLVSLGNVETM